MLEEVFKTKINLYDPSTSRLIGNGPLDSFTASQVLSLKNLIMSNWTGTMAELKDRVEPLLAINGTANDFLVDSESQLNAIQGELTSIAVNNKNAIWVILFSENFALLALGVSLLVVARVVIRTHSRTFRALSQLTSKSIDERIYTVKKFQQSLKDNIEAKSFSQNLGLFLNFFEDSNPQKFENLKAKENGKKLGSRNFTLHPFMLYIGRFLIMSFFFLLVVSGFLAVLYIKSFARFNTLNHIQKQLSVINQVSYKNTMVVSSFYFYAIFRNRNNFLIRNESPLTQLDKNLQVYSTVNQKLLNQIVDSESYFKDDPILKELLHSNACIYLGETVGATCETLSNGIKTGLMGFNSRFYSQSANFIMLLKEATTDAEVKPLAESYLEAIFQDVAVLDASFNFLSEYMVKGFRNQIHHFEELNLYLTIAILSFIILTTIIIQMVSLNRLIQLDNSQKKLFRSLTYHVFSQNKTVGFLLKKDFGDEVEGMNRILYAN